MGIIDSLRSVKIQVPGEGPKKARIIIVGEAPGRDEVIQRRPFVGKAGRFLRKTLINNRINFQKVYITNVIKFRPPGNRKPTKKEVALYLPVLKKEIYRIKPKIICLLGNTAIEALLGKYQVSKIHGKIIKKEDMNYFTTFHPAVAMRNRKWRRMFEKDIRKLSGYLNMQP